MLFDIMVGHKNRKFLMPKDFVKLTASVGAHTPRVMYEGNMNDQFIQDVRDGKYDVVEGVVCKGSIRIGAHRGGMWMAKVKTKTYLDRLKGKFGEKEAEKYGE